MAGWTKAERGLVATAALLVFSRVFGLSIVMPDFRRHYDTGLGFDPLWVGIAFGAYGLTMALMQLPSGMLSDRFGRRPLLLLSCAFFVGGSLVAAVAGSPGVLVAGRLLQGLGAVSSVATAAVGETMPAQRRTTAMALVGIPAGAGFLGGMIAGPVLYPVIDMPGLFYVTAAMGLLAAVPVAWRAWPRPEHHGESRPGERVRHAATALAMAGFVMNYLLVTTLFFLPATGARALVPPLVVALLVVLAAGRRIDKAGWTWQPVAVALPLLAIAAVVFAWQPPGWRLWAAGALFFSTHAVLNTVIPSQVSRIAGTQGGRGHGIQNVIAYGGTFAAGVVAGVAAHAPWIAFAGGGLLAAGAAILLAAWLKGSPKPS